MMYEYLHLWPELSGASKQPQSFEILPDDKY